MAYFGFSNKLRNNETIQIFNYGKCKRGFTYVDDIIIREVKRVCRLLWRWWFSVSPYTVYNIGNSHLENLLEFVDILQKKLIRAGVLPEDYDFEAHKKLVPMQLGEDVLVTYANMTALEEDFGFRPSVLLRRGKRKFIV